MRESKVECFAQSGRQRFVRNAILANLAPSDLVAVGQFVEPCALEERAVLQDARRPAEHIYFPETALISVRIVAPGSMLEIALVGCRGAVGAPCLFGECNSTHQSVVLLPGSGYRIYVEDLRRLMKERPTVRQSLLQYAQALTVHTTQTSLCGVRHHLDGRLACWLCLACDAMDDNVLPITHEYVSGVLGLRRAGVTKALIRFEDRGLIRKTRGVLQIADRERLEQESCSCYSIIASEYMMHGGRVPNARPTEASSSWRASRSS